MSNRAEERAMLIKKLQEELDRRTELEEEAIYLMEQGEFERANQLLKSIDDSIAKRCIYSKKCLEKKKIIVKFRISDPISYEKIGEVIRKVQSAIPYDILHFEVDWNNN